MTLGRPFRVLWSANALSNLSDGLAFVSMPLLAASMTDDPRWVAGLATLYAVVRLVVVLFIFHAVVWNICSTSIRQQAVPSDMLGRVGAATRVLGLLGLTLGSALGGVLATVHIALPTAAGAVVFGLCALIALYSMRGETSAISRHLPPEANMGYLVIRASSYAVLSSWSSGL